jgi:putative MATE family efflux protein
MDADPRTQRLATEPVGRLIVRFSAPVIANLLLVAVYNLVDRVFVGRGVGATALAGITVSFPVLIVLGGVGLWFGEGAGTVVALALGRRDRARAEAAQGTAFAVGAVAGLAAVAGAALLLRPLLAAFGGSGEVLAQAERFAAISLVGVIFQVAGAALAASMRSAGEPGFALTLALTGTAVNVVLNPLLIFGFHLGVAGSALATCAASAASFALALAHACGPRAALRLRRAHLAPALGVLRQVLALGAPPLCMQLALTAIMALSNRAVAAHGGATGIAVMGIVYVLYPLVLLPLAGIQAGAQPVLGFNFGAGAHGRVRRALVLALGAATALCAAAWLPLLAWPDAIVRLFVGDAPQVLAVGPPALRTFFALLPVVGAQVVGAGYFQAVGKAGVSFFANLLRQVVVLVPLLLVLPPALGLRGVWLANPLSDAVSAAITLALVVPELRRLAAGRAPDTARDRPAAAA